MFVFLYGHDPHDDILVNEGLHVTWWPDNGTLKFLWPSDIGMTMS